MHGRDSTARGYLESIVDGCSPREQAPAVADSRPRRGRDRGDRPARPPQPLQLAPVVRQLQLRLAADFVGGQLRHGELERVLRRVARQRPGL